MERITGRLSLMAGVIAAAGSAALAVPPYQVTISGAHQLSDIFAAPASTNQWLNIDGTGITGFDEWRDPIVRQLVPDWPNNNGWWTVQFRGVGAGTGLLEVATYYNTTPGDYDLNAPADTSYINRTLFYDLSGPQGPGQGVVAPHTKPLYGGSPVKPLSVDIAPLDTPIWWQVPKSGTPGWNRTPAQAGYGNNPQGTWDLGYLGKLPALPAGAGVFGHPNAGDHPLFDTLIAWAIEVAIANQGTGIQNINASDLQYLQVTGRSSSGENLQVVTREPTAGQRNAFLNGIGVDPSWGRGDNLGTKTTVITQEYLQPGWHANSAGSGTLARAAVQNGRLAVGYKGLEGAGGAVSDAYAGYYEILNVKKDIKDAGGVPYGGTTYVRPSLNAFLHNNDVNTGWQIGGTISLATVGDPEATQTPGDPNWVSTGNPALFNPQAALYIQNITHSIRDFVAYPSAPVNYNLPGQYLASNYVLIAAVDGVPSDADPTKYTANPAQNVNVRQWTQGNYNLVVPDFGSIAPYGLVPFRNSAAGPFNDGLSTSYKDQFNGATVAYGTKLSWRNRVQGDFNNDGKRDLNDIPSLIQAIKDPANFEIGREWGHNRGDQAHDSIVLNVLGDFNGDGNFDAKDIRYFADGLAIDPVTGKLDRKRGFIAVDTAWQSLAGSNNFFGTTLVTGKPYTLGASRADIAGNATHPGADPAGADGVIDAKDVRYIKANFGSWSNLDQASKIDLSADLNGDLVVDQNDVVEILTNVLGTHLGDINLDGYVNVGDLQVLVAGWGTSKGSTGYDSLTDINSDGYVNVGDLQQLVTNWGS